MVFILKKNRKKQKIKIDNRRISVVVYYTVAKLGDPEKSPENTGFGP